jgi:hypothetical protein
MYLGKQELKQLYVTDSFLYKFHMMISTFGTLILHHFLYSIPAKEIMFCESLHVRLTVFAYVVIHSDILKCTCIKLFSAFLVRIFNHISVQILK